ncbi:MAG: heparinase II/III-family protein [Tannerella sp.]|jgi:hypothetical protein|nr:heparinase II/III-family protein [Tannerella sp.]
MRKILYLLFAVVFSSPLFSQAERNLLTKKYSDAFLKETLVKDNSWVPFPKYSDRTGWEKLPLSVRQKYIEAGERYLDYGWPAVRATEYLAFSRTGDRTVMEIPQNQRMKALQSLVLAELSEGRGRFMDDIVNGVFSFCEQTSWCLSACFYMHNRGKDSWNGELGETNLPDVEDPIIDLWVGEMAADLSWIWYFFHDEFDKISPVISRRIKYELKNKVLEPFYERNDYWWITGWGRGSVNNWTPWCNYNVLTCIALIEDDPEKKSEGVYKTMTSVDLFFNVYADDGGCDEGPSYWGVAGGKAFDYLTLLNFMTKGKVAIFDDPLIKAIGQYICLAYIADGKYFMNFADASAQIHPNAGIIYRYGEQTGDETMMRFGVYLLDMYHSETQPEIASLGPTLGNLFMLKDYLNKPKEEPLVASHYFPDLQVAIARDKAGTTDGFYIAAKGGNNGESHNHNDVGSCIIFYNGMPVLVDAGVGTYTRETFSSDRYKIWTMQSTYHNLPLINGVAQTQGRQYKALSAKFADSKSTVTFSTDIAGAYPETAKVEKWLRKYTLQRNKKVIISDQYELKEVIGGTQARFLTPCQCSVILPGIIEMKIPNAIIRMKYRSDGISARIEKKQIDDPKLKNVWGDELSVIVLDYPTKRTGNISVEISAVLQ